ncbi:MAG: hypothetical protein Q4C85_07170 [Actinomyces sp.]|uniref:FtsK/SpoIIIE domain-containing protein n=1 Tax=Actinomyces sp. TaxID=29317 RepID=UPI0026DB6E11|nr:FtsK/SpoIIIE domain-containing protein [Actinomyces sp.]MDO4243523.1 hypothetical protein [Actinomyces sp.]
MLRWVAVPRGLWPVQTSLLAAVGACACVVGVPVRPGLGWLTLWGPACQAVAGLLLVVGLERWWRVVASADEPGPGTPLVALGRCDRARLGTVAVVAAIGAVLGVWTREVSAAPLLWCAGCLALGAATGVWAVCRRMSWASFALRKGRRAVWRARWAALPRQEPAPFLAGVEQVGPFLVETFECPPGRRPAEYLALRDAVASLAGAGSDVHVLPARAGGGGVDPSRFVVCSVERGARVDVGAVQDARTVEIACSRVLAEVTGKSSMVVERVEPLTTAPGPRVWRLHLGEVDVAAAAMALEAVGPVLADGGTLLVGPRDGARWVDPDLAGHVADLEVGAEWEAHFREVLRPTQLPPAPQVRFLDTQEVAGVEVHRLPFASRQGMDVAAAYLPLAQRLRTTMPSAPFLAVLGMPPTEGDSAPGTRSDKFFSVVWSTSPVPACPADLPPTVGWGSSSAFDARDGAALVLAGLVDEAFRAVFGAKGAPELVDAVCVSDARPWIWRARLRLYGGVSIADLRRRADRLGSLMRAEWLRVRPSGDLVEIYLGARPASARVAPRWRRLLAELDFEQVFVDAKVLTASGLTPVLESLDTLAGNPDVSVYDFTLPAGLSAADVVGRREKVAAAAGLAFLRLVPGADPSHVRLLAAERNPIPDAAAYDLRAAAALAARHGNAGGLRVAWGVGIDGTPVTWNMADTPHCLVLGPTGTGKTVALVNAVAGVLLAGWDVVVADPVKGGADFTPLAPFLRGVAGTVDDAAAVLKCVYAEIARRKDLNAQHGAPSVDDLPEEMRPHHMLVVIDEFTSLLLPEKIARARTTDPEVLAERAETERVNDLRATIATLVGKIGREARSAGVHILLGAQALRADTIRAIPGNDLKTNTGRLLLGMASYGDLASGLRKPDEAPTLMHATTGRGLWEPLSAAATEVQAWHTPTHLLAQELGEHGVTEREDLRVEQATAPTPGRAYSEIPAQYTGQAAGETLEPLELADLGLSGLDLGGGSVGDR